MRLNLSTIFGSGSETGQPVPAQALAVVFESLSLITNRLESGEKVLPKSIESIDFEWSGGSFAPDLKSSVTIIDPRPSPGRVIKYLLTHLQPFRLGTSVPTEKLAEGLLDLIADEIDFKRTKKAA